MIWFVGIVFTVSILFLIYASWTFSYWSRRGVKQEYFVLFLSLLKRLSAKKIIDVDIIEELYAQNPKDRFVGSYFFATPLLIIRDPELIKHVLIRDFDTFHSRGVFSMESKPETFLNQILTVEGDKWKLLRQNLSPAFTSGRIKAMFPIIVERAEKLQRIVCEAKSGEIDAQDIIIRYSIDVISACGFGLDIDTLNGNHDVLYKLKQRFFTKTPREVLIYALKYTMPGLFGRLHLVAPFVEDTIFALVEIIMKQRSDTVSNRCDFIDLMLELKRKGKMSGDSLITKNSEGSPCKVEMAFDEALLAAQVLVYFMAGTDTTETATSYTLYELGHHPEYQRKCQEEINSVLARHGNQLNFEAIKEMKYLDACFREGLRLFTPLGCFLRQCKKRYTIPGTDVTIDPGVLAIIPVQAMHVDPEHFPNPDEFCPDRFHPDNAATLNKHAYMPFGGGPRGCIGEQLGHMQSLAALAAVLRRTTVTSLDVRPRRPPQDPTAALTQRHRGPLLLKITPLSE